MNELVFVTIIFVIISTVLLYHLIEKNKEFDTLWRAHLHVYDEKHELEKEIRIMKQEGQRNGQHTSCEKYKT